MIYLDNAATTSPKPKAVIGAVTKALKDASANPGRSGHSMSAAAAETVFDCRARAAGFFSAQNPEEVVFTKNCTEAVNMVLKGFLKPGDHVVTSSLEHNAVMRPLHKLTETGVEYDTAPVDLFDPEETARAFGRLMTKQTRLVICSHASNVLGVRLPVEQIGALCYERGVAFAVDAAQSAGVLPVDMEKMHIDFLCVAPHKGLYAPMGTGLLIAKKPLGTLLEGGTWTLSVSLEQPQGLPERLESGTVNVPGAAGVAAGIGFVSQRPAGRIHSYETGLVRTLYRLLARIPEVKLYTPEPDDARYVGVLSFNVGDASSEAVAAALDKGGFAVRAGLHCAPSVHRRLGTLSQGLVRASVSVFTTPDQIERFARFIENFVKNNTKNH